MTPPPLALNGAALVPDGSGALHWPARETLAVADLHLEKGSSYPGGGLPPHDSAATLDRLEAVLDRLTPATVICLGDSFHDAGGPARLPDRDRARLARLTGACRWVWLAGNHDPAPTAELGGEAAGELALDPLVFRHIARADGPVGEVSGHYHPKATVRVRGRPIRRACFVGDGRRLVLPAFGAYTGGLNVREPAVRGLFPHGFTVHLLSARGVRRVPGARLAA